MAEGEGEQKRMKTRNRRHKTSKRKQEVQTKATSTKGEKARARKCGDVAILIVRIGVRICEVQRQLEMQLDKGARAKRRIEGRRASVYGNVYNV